MIARLTLAGLVVVVVVAALIAGWVCYGSVWWVVGVG